MDPISNSDRIALIIRQRLLERSRTSAGGRRGRSESKTQPAINGLNRVRELASIDGIDERQVRRVFIQTILTDQLGAELINDAQFQQLVVRVTDAIEEDEQSTQLLTRLIQELRGI